MTEKNIIVALDDPLDYQGVLEVLDPKKCIIKVGSVIFNYHGRKILDEVSGKRPIAEEKTLYWIRYEANF